MKLDLDEGLCRTLMSTPLKKYNVEQVSGRVGTEVLWVQNFVGIIICKVLRKLSVSLMC